MYLFSGGPDVEGVGGVAPCREAHTELTARDRAQLTECLTQHRRLTVLLLTYGRDNNKHIIQNTSQGIDRAQLTECLAQHRRFTVLLLTYGRDNNKHIIQNTSLGIDRAQLTERLTQHRCFTVLLLTYRTKNTLKCSSFTLEVFYCLYEMFKLYFEVF